VNNQTNLSSLIWSSADDVLRGLFKPSEYGRVILPFVVMRRLDCVLEPKKDEVYELNEKFKELSDPTPVILKQIGLPFFNVSKYDLSRIKSDPTNVLINFNNYVQGYSKNVLDIIEHFSINPLVEKLHKNKRLYQLVDKFTEFDLHPNKIDNHQMGSVYEELLRKFSEMSNEESGDHFTPRDVVKLLVSFVFGGDKEDLKGEGKIRSVFDPCCGTGGMLTIGKEWVHENINPDLKIDLYGQELNDVTYSICKSDLLMMDENPENIHGPCSSISDDRLQGRKFDYMITNPPFGVSWKSESDFVKEEAKDPNGRFFVGTPRTSDGSLLFLQHLIHKMNPEGSRIGIVFNGSPLFTGDAGSGESDIRKWIIENDWLECIVQLPDQMFFNTGITTYFWVVTNKKSPERRGKVLLIDGSSFHQIMKKSLGSKRKWITPEQSDELFDIYQSFEEGEFSKVYSNNFFGYTKVVVEQPLYEDGKLKTDKKGNPKPDTSKRDNERVPLSENVDDYFQREVKPHLLNSWMDRSKDKIGYEVNFTKYFYKFVDLRDLDEIARDLKLLDQQIHELSEEITHG
jgi:type I restriction enzyme M protein